MNKVLLMGNVVRENSVSGNGKVLRVANTIAVDRASKNKSTDFIPIVVFGKSAELFNKYVSKGAMVFLEGTLQVNQYTDAEGNKKYSSNVVVNNFRVLKYPKASIGFDQDNQGEDFIPPVSEDIEEDFTDFINESPDDSIPF